MPAASVNVMPEGLDFTTAAAIPLAAAAASTAVGFLGDAAAAGSVVLVNGASGGVGSYVVQLLAARHVDVVATGQAADAERLHELGVKTTIDYTVGSVVEQVRGMYPDGVDALVNLAGNTPDQIPLGAVKAGGVVSFTTMGPGRGDPRRRRPQGVQGDGEGDARGHRPRRADDRRWVHAGQRRRGPRSRPRRRRPRHPRRGHGARLEGARDSE